MEALTFDFLKAHLIIAAGYCLYKLALASQPGFQANRFILVAIATAALALPFWPTFGGSEQLAIISVDLPEFVFSDNAADTSKTSWITLLIWGYALVASLLVGRTIWQIVRLLLIGKGNSQNDIRILETTRVKTSSFFKRIYIEPTMDASTREMVLAHEKVHANQWHTLDTLLFELITALFWINPAVWLLKRELRDVHEYIADAETNKQFGSQKYINALLNQTFQTNSVNFLPMFNHSQTLKNRIVMITSKKSIARMRYLLFLPAMATIVFTAACTKQIENEDAETTQQDKLPVLKEGDVYSIVETMPEFPGGTEALFGYLVENITYPEEAKTNKIEGTVNVRFVVDVNGQIINSEVMRGIGAGCDEEALRVINEMPNWSPGMQDGEPVKVEFNLPIHYNLE